MSEIVLSAETTRITGTRSSRRLRREGRVPAVVYGLNQDPVSIDVDWPELRRVLTTDAGVNAVIHLEFGGEKQMSIVKDIQR
ncbi:MAG: 50S ribosomal protein L25, partial [Actinomycetota bacterium]|nr:50S ribosomal protein L25 [Actinomycetota bacterium]